MNVIPFTAPTRPLQFASPAHLVAACYMAAMVAAPALVRRCRADLAAVEAGPDLAPLRRWLLDNARRRPVSSEMLRRRAEAAGHGPALGVLERSTRFFGWLRAEQDPAVTCARLLLLLDALRCGATLDDHVAAFVAVEQQRAPCDGAHARDP